MDGSGSLLVALDHYGSLGSLWLTPVFGTTDLIAKENLFLSVRFEF